MPSDSATGRRLTKKGKSGRVVVDNRSGHVSDTVKGVRDKVGVGVGREPSKRPNKGSRVHRREPKAGDVVKLDIELHFGGEEGEHKQVTNAHGKTLYVWR